MLRVKVLTQGSRLGLGLASAVLISATGGVFAQTSPSPVTVPAGGEVTVEAGQAAPIYGARARCDSTTPPTFERVMERGLETAPEHGELSDGGVGRRHSDACQGMVPMRVVNYTADPDYVGTDRLVIYGDEVTITVEGANPTEQ